MTRVLIVAVLLGAACLYAWRAGGAPERLAALTVALGAAAAVLLPFRSGHGDQDSAWLILAVDVAMLAGLLAIALRADRYWPLYVAACHLVTFGIHGARALRPSLVPWPYAAASSGIAAPMLVLLAVGALRHRHRIARFGSDSDWSPRP